MSIGRVSHVVTCLRRLALRQDRGASDAQLLERFLARREEGAFAELVRRHGPLVLGVCHRVLGEAQAAEDAFQATFLVLVRRASSIVPRSSVGAWLGGVARRTALKARTAAARRRRAEGEVARRRPWAAPPPVGESLRPLFDEEIGRLPERYRAAVVLCLLEGRSRKEAATLLGWSEGTLSGRLARAKELLGERLRRRGVTLAGAALLAALAEYAAAREVPPALALLTAQAASWFAGSGGSAQVSPSVVALTEEVLQNMLMSKLKTVAVVLALLLGVGLGMSFALRAEEQVPATRSAVPQPMPYATDAAGDSGLQVALELRILTVTDDCAERLGWKDGLGGPRFLDDRQLFAFFEIAQADAYTNIIQAPKVTLWDGQTGALSVGDSDVIVTRNDFARGEKELVPSPETNRVETGTFVRARPEVSADRRFIRVALNVESSDREGPAQTKSLGPQDRAAEAGAGQTPAAAQQIRVPRKVVRLQVAKTVVIPEGRTVLLSGQKSVREVREERRIPLLGELPYVGDCFTYARSRRVTETTFLLVRPRVLTAEDLEVPPLSCPDKPR
jgi:RNA polymerase sigma factor (sigma-70 family)